MKKFRKFLCWIFAITCLICLWIDCRRILRTLHRLDGHFSSRSLILPAMFTILVFVYGLTWWTVLKERPSGRGWGAAASLIYILVSICGILFFAQSVLGYEGIVLALGIVGLVVFVWRDERHEPNEDKSGAAGFGPTAQESGQPMVGGPRGPGSE